eukprot:TRINITY_DN13965_c1_g2_i3.p2 TRINITY_DN13965_c1_g2~~TRINITY_DN13965_c1_g2_i3.p2  ORF type:complete len:223 (+),score=48.59 TRINITY_DN13965_c1_g2_i3:645-1313(+)
MIDGFLMVPIVPSGAVELAMFRKPSPHLPGSEESLPTEASLKAALLNLGIEPSAGSASKEAKAGEDGKEGSEEAAPAKSQAARDPWAGFLGEYEKPGAYAFRIGDIVVHRKFGQVGVVAERFDVCQLGPEWMAANAPPGMSRDQPFYTILMDGVPNVDFTRHGAQSSHRRYDVTRDGPLRPIQHKDITRLFGKLDRKLMRYELSEGEDNSKEELVEEWDKVK